MSSNAVSSNSAKAWARWQMPQMHDEVMADEPLRPTASFSPDEALSSSRDEARRSGWEQGLSEGRQAARGELKLQADRLQHVIEQLASPLAEAGQEIQDELVKLAMAIAQQVVVRELNTQPEQIRDVVTQAIAALPAGNRHLRIHLHPEDAHLLIENIDVHEGGSWKIIEDVSLTRGGCIVDTGATRIDARLETRLQDILGRLQSHSPLTAAIA
ncbi:MAG: FliH/SctL family protein [Pseudomonadota bacterium]